MKKQPIPSRVSALLNRLFVTVLTISALTPLAHAASVGSLRCEHLQDPLGLDVKNPRLSWIVSSDQRGDFQSAYQILVASSAAGLAKDSGDLWDTGKIVSDQSVLLNYAGKPLVSGERCFWKVRVWDRNGKVSKWSPAGTWSIGLLNASEWSAKWIGMTTPTNISPAAPSPMLRKKFTVSKPVARATAYICGLGYYELQLNGSKVGDHVLDPTWTRYDFQACYVTYDVTSNLVAGQNAVGVQLANGFYNQWTTDAWNTFKAPWRALPQMLLRLDVEYTDGTRDVVVSDETWKTATGPLLLDQTRLGEVYDARLEKPGWSTANYDDSKWKLACLREGPGGTLIAPNAEPIKITKTVCPVKITPVAGKTGVYTFDFGQNLVGWGRLSVKGPAGTSVKMVFGEKINRDGSVDQGNINVYVNSQQKYFQTDIYTLKGGDTETWEPRFTYHGFRYAQVEGLLSAPTSNTLVARVVNTAFDSAGTFLCSNELLNRIETNTIWSYVGNFVGIPTDCPQREKNGWTGDAQLACEMGLTHFHSEAAYASWIRQFRPAQRPNGKLPSVIPNPIWGYNICDGPAWESAYLLVPWFVYQHCGDAGILTNNYDGMKAYVDYCTSVASNNIVSYGLGDWLPANTTTPAAVTGTAYYYQDALVLAHAASLMRRSSESQQYSNLAARIRVAFNNTFLNTNNNLYAGGTQTAQSCALYQGLVESDRIPAVTGALAENVRKCGNTIDTGILGSKYLLRALSDNGHSETALALATQTAYPSWGNWIGSGATTLWESWGGSDSLNHIMFGDISAWFIEYLAGIRPGTPGYKTVIIKPEIMNGLTWANATHESPYGTISSAWQLAGESVTLNIIIPANCSAMVYLPTMGTKNVAITEGRTTIWKKGATVKTANGVAFDHLEGSAPQTYSVWKVASGKYQFSWNVSPAPSGLTAQAGNRRVTLNWNGVQGATNYNVKRSMTPGGDYKVVKSGIAATNYVDSAATNGTTWFYVVSAVRPSGESLNSSEVSAAPAGILNAGFESPRVSGYQYNPPGGSWKFGGATGNGSGITGNNSGFTTFNASAPEGSQVAFVQRKGSMSQTLCGLVPGTSYTLTFSAAQRAGDNQNGGQSWDVKIDDKVIANYNPGAKATAYADYTAEFTATAASHTLAFVGTDLVGGDNTVFIDNVRITPPNQPDTTTP